MRRTRLRLIDASPAVLRSLFETRGNATVTVGWASIDEAAEDGQQFGVFRFGIPPPRLRLPRGPCMDLRTADAQNLGHAAHRKPSFGSDGRCQVCFFTCAFAKASRRISCAWPLGPMARPCAFHRLAAEKAFEVADPLFELADLGGAHHRLV